jgi:hypothetical protein
VEHYGVLVELIMDPQREIYAAIEDGMQAIVRGFHVKKLSRYCMYVHFNEEGRVFGLKDATHE